MMTHEQIAAEIDAQLLKRDQHLVDSVMGGAAFYIESIRPLMTRKGMTPDGELLKRMNGWYFTDMSAALIESLPMLIEKATGIRPMSRQQIFDMADSM